MLQRSDCLGALFEASHEVRVGGDGFAEDLDGDVSLDPRLDRAEDDTLRTLEDLLEESIAPKRLAAQMQSPVLAQDSLCNLTSSADGSIPSSSARTSLARWKAANASA